MDKVNWLLVRLERSMDNLEETLIMVRVQYVQMEFPVFRFRGDIKMINHLMGWNKPEQIWGGFPMVRTLEINSAVANMHLCKESQNCLHRGKEEVPGGSKPRWWPDGCGLGIS